MAAGKKHGIKGEARKARSPEGEDLTIHVLHFGAVEWFSIGDFARLMDKYRCDGKPDLTGCRVLLRNLGVPLVDWCNGQTYFQFSAFEKAVHLVSRYGGPGFIAPNTSHTYETDEKGMDRYGRIRRVTPEVIGKYGAGLEEDLALLRTQKTRASRSATVKHANKAGRAFMRQVEKELQDDGQTGDG